MNAFEIKIPEDRLRTAQIIAFAMPTGCAGFIAIITTIMEPLGPPFNFEIDILLWVLIGQCAMLLPAAGIIPSLVYKQLAKQKFANVPLLEAIEKESRGEVQPVQINQFMQIFQTRMIIGSALIEGIVLFGAVTYLVNQTIIGLAIAGLLTIVLYTRFPTLTSVQNSLANLASEQEYKRSQKV